MDDRSSKPKPPGNKTDKRGKGHKDVNELAFSIVQKATGDAPPDCGPKKNPAAVTLGRLGGLKGGKARAEALSPRRRQAIAKKAAAARWNKSD